MTLPTCRRCKSQPLVIVYGAGTVIRCPNHCDWAAHEHEDAARHEWRARNRRTYWPLVVLLIAATAYMIVSAT